MEGDHDVVRDQWSGTPRVPLHTMVARGDRDMGASTFGTKEAWVKVEG